MKYSDKLKDPRWQKKRLKILERDDWTCQCCGDKSSTLHVHHLKYSPGNPWDINENYLITLCEDCHENEHQIRDEYESTLLDSLKYNGFIADEVFMLADCFIFSLTRDD